MEPQDLDIGHLFDKIRDAVVVAEATSGQIVLWNLAATEIFGYRPAEALGMKVEELIPERLKARHREGLSRYRDTGHGPYVDSHQLLDLPAVHKGGEEFRIELSLNPISPVSEYIADRHLVLAIIRDITERERAEEKISQSEKRFRSLIQNASDVITLLEADGTIKYESPSTERILGYRPEELVGKSAFDYIHPDDLERVLSAFAEALAHPELHPSAEYRFRHKNGSWRYLESIGINLLDDPDVREVVVNSRDITERKALEEQLRHRAFHDSLTNLPNRILFMDRLHHALARGRRDKNTVAVLYLDVDNVKVVNDSLGHACGDQLLSEVAGRLLACVRPEDTVARLGGDEFAILLEDVAGMTDATQAADRIVQQLRAPFNLADREVFVTISVGVTLSASAYDRPEDLVHKADTAMYQAKNTGKDHHKMFHSSMTTYALQCLELSNDIRQAIERNEFKVYYQPKVWLETGRGTDMEALVRWEHPQRGLVLPDEFISVAEETGLIAPIGRWVLREACRQVRRWQEQYPSDPPLRVSVNLSARQFQDPNLVEDITGALRESGLDPFSLELEITESVVMDNAPATLTTLQKLKDLGVGISIDDFGTGYSSLSYLNRFPVDTLKIDRSFLNGAQQDPEDTIIVSAIINLAHSLGLKAIAEGVESAKQLAQLREMGCDMAQGYYFSKPLSSEAAGAFLERFVN